MDDFPTVGESFQENGVDAVFRFFFRFHLPAAESINMILIFSSFTFFQKQTFSSSKRSLIPPTNLGYSLLHVFLEPGHEIELLEKPV